MREQEQFIDNDDDDDFMPSIITNIYCYLEQGIGGSGDNYIIKIGNFYYDYNVYVDDNNYAYIDIMTGREVRDTMRLTDFWQGYLDGRIKILDYEEVNLYDVATHIYEDPADNQEIYK